MSRILIGSRILRPLVRFQSSFSAGKRGDFFQAKPEITNQFLEDPFLIEQLELEIPEPVELYSTTPTLNMIFYFIHKFFI